MTEDKIIAARKRQLENLVNSNERTYSELQQKVGGRFSLDTTSARLEMLLSKFIEWGLVSEEQGLDFELEFHAKVEDTLAEAWEQVRQQEKAANLLVPNKPNNIVDMHGRPMKS